MGRCYCGKDTGWGGGKECEECYEERRIHYNDKVKIIKGFYKDQIGKIAGEYKVIGHDNARFAFIYGYPVRFENGDIKNVDQFDIEKVKA